MAHTDRDARRWQAHNIDTYAGNYWRDGINANTDRWRCGDRLPDSGRSMAVREWNRKHRVYWSDDSGVMLSARIKRREMRREVRRALREAVA